MAFVDPRRAGHEFDRGDAKPREMRDRGLAREALEGSAQRLRHVRMSLGEALDMQFIEDRVLPRMSRPRGRIGARRARGDALWREGRAVAPIEREIRRRVVRLIAEHRGVQSEGPVELQRVRIDQKFRRVEAKALFGFIGAVSAQSVTPALRQSLDMRVKHIAGAMTDAKAFDFDIARFVEQAKVDRSRRRGEDRDIGARRRQRQAERLGRALRDARHGAPDAARAASRPR